MIKAFIVYNEYSNSKSTRTKIERLIEEGNKLDIHFDVYTNLDLDFYFKDGKEYIPTIDNKDYKFCIFLDKDKYLSKAIDRKILMINNFQSIFDCDDKMETYQKLVSLDIKTPLIVPAPLNYSNKNDEDLKKKFLKKVTSKLNFPIVVKESFGSLGMQVHLANNYEELSSYYDKLITKPHFYSEYISYEKGTDYRVITVGKRVICCMQRHNDNDFRSNIALGGKGKKYKLPKEVEDMVVKIVSALNLEYSGVDLIKDSDNQYKLLEVNSNAFFEGVEAVTKINVTRELLHHILSLLNR